MCLSQMYRIRHLRLMDVAVYDEDEELLTQAAPVLTSFELNGTHLPSTPIFSGINPHLQHLRIHTTPFAIPSPLITPIMTTLRMVRCCEPLHGDHLINLLSALPNLTELALVLCFTASDDVISPPRCLSLPTLQVLSLTEGRYEIVFGLLRCLDISQTATSVIWPGEFGYLGDLTDADLNNFWTNFNLFLHEAQIPIRRLEFDKHSTGCDVTISSSLSQHRYTLEFPRQNLDDHTRARFISTIPLIDLETLITNDLPEGTLDYITALTKLRTITVTRHAAWTFIKAFSPESKHAPEAMPFPAVKALTLCHAWVEDDDIIGWSLLEDILDIRRKAGLSLDRLVFVECFDFKIFTHAQEYNGSVFSQEADFDTRFVVSWVCRHWRDTALADSTLWTVISKVDVHADLVQELLNRSQNSSLSVDLQEPLVYTSKLCLSQLSRIRHLRLATLPNSSEVEDRLVRPAPLITSLELVNIYLPSAPLFSEVHPHLRHVILEDVPFLTPSPSISLIISTLRIVNPSEFIEVEYLVGLLPYFRSLTELALVLCFDHSSAIVPPLQRIALPTLQVLSVTDREYMTIFGFLTCLDVPQAAITVIWPGALGEWMTHFEMNQFLTGIHLYSHESKSPLLIRHLKLDRDAGDCTIDISSSPSHHRHSFSFPKQDLDGRFTHKFLTWAIPLDNIETLVINDLPEDTLNSIIGSTTLNSLTVSGEEASWKCILALDFEPVHAT
ncbi:hypothetical protein BDN72DRAFT_884263, partial [Pluteus cervinus]